LALERESRTVPKLKHLTPSYRRHKATGQAVVTLAGRDIYLGKHNTAASRREYSRIIGEWTASGGTLTAQHDLTVVELCAPFMRHAESYYRRPDGSPTSERESFKLVVGRLKATYGRTPVSEFGPLALKAVRQAMIDDGLCRNVINRSVNRIRHIFKWGVENELVGPSVLHGLQAVAGLRAGRSGARETKPVKPVPDVFVDAVLPHVSPQVAAMIRLQRLTGMRSGEVNSIRGCDINTGGKVWVYTPTQHKTAWHGHDRQVYLGPKAQAVIKPFFKADLQAYLFSPGDAEVERNGRRFGVVSPDRKTKVYPSELRGRQRRRAKRNRREFCDRYDSRAYARAVTRGIEFANRAWLAEGKAKGIVASQVELIPHWHPHQLRHNAATALRREHGIEVARIVLGHRSPAITEVYAEADHTRAIDVMAKVG
jgi:integrase